MAFIIPGVSGTVESSTPSLQQAAPLMRNYSPRLFGSPPQLTSLNDMRLMSSDGNTEGPVGDFYLRHVLRDAQVCNFVIGRALFTGGMSSVANAFRVLGQYKHAISKYKLDGGAITGGTTSASSQAQTEQLKQEYLNALVSDSGKYETAKASAVGGILTDEIGEDTEVLNDPSISNAIQKYISGSFGKSAGVLSAALLTSLSVQQPFYTFESDWNSYINNVKMMVDAAIVMLGLQDACVRIGDNLLPIAPTTKMNMDGSNDAWSMYRFITPSQGLAAETALDTQNGETSQYVSFMVDPKGISESYSNTAGESQIYASVINSGESLGNEIAFITSSTQSAVDDAVVNLAGDAITLAEGIMSKLGTAGRFTAAIASSMFRSFKGDHTVYPLIFQKHSSNESPMSMTVRLRASGGDPYSYLTEILVPMFFALAMVLPQMSRNSGAAYSYPPLVQCNIPGIWGTRLGLVTGLTITKNPDGNDISVFGYPTAVDMTIQVTDLQHTLMTSPLNKLSTMLNNHSMYDYIAQCCGVDKYRVNGSMRIITKAILAASDGENLAYNVGTALKSDFYDWANRFLGTSRM